MSFLDAFHEPPARKICQAVFFGTWFFSLILLFSDPNVLRGNLLMLLPGFAASLRFFWKQYGAIGLCLGFFCILPCLCVVAGWVTDPDGRLSLTLYSALFAVAAVGLQLPSSLDDDWERHWRKREEEETRQVWREARQGQSQERQRNREAFVILLVRLLVRVARADGGLSRQDESLIRDFFKDRLRYSGKHLERIQQLLRQEAETEHDLAPLLADFCRRFAPLSRLLPAELCYRLAHGTCPPSAARLRLAREIASKLDLDPVQRRSLEAKYGTGAKQERTRQESRQDRQTRRDKTRQEEESRWQRRRRVLLTPEDEQAFAALGLSPDVKFTTVRKAYRKLARQYHPDTVAHLGEAYRCIATGKMQAINAAYSRLERKFGKEAGLGGGE